MNLRRSWSGLDAVLVATPAGPTRAPASSSHRLGIHVGRPVRARCSYDGRTHHRLQARGDIDLVPAGVPGVWEDDRPTTILRLSVSPALLGSAATALGLDADRVELVPQYQLRDPHIEHLAWALEAEMRAGITGDALYGDSLAIALAAHLIRRYRVSAGAPREPRGGLSAPQLTRIKDHIEAHLDGPIALADLARVAGLSASHLKTLFRRSTGSPVHQFVVRRRVERARILLTESASSLSDVAARAGFADQSHMARWVRRVLGVPPAALRRDR